MWTAWRAARSITQLEQNQIAYTDGQGLLDRTTDVITVDYLSGNQTSRGQLVTVEANSLLFSDFGFSIGSATVSGIALWLETQRLSRIQDRVIQLYAGGAVGLNRANYSAEDSQLYGGESDLWGLIDLPNFDDPAFGVIIDLQPHRVMPSANPAIIRRVSMRLWLS